MQEAAVRHLGLGCCKSFFEFKTFETPFLLRQHIVTKIIIYDKKRAVLCSDVYRLMQFVNLRMTFNNL